jgi:hypothetical protein
LFSARRISRSGIGCRGVLVYYLWFHIEKPGDIVLKNPNAPALKREAAEEDWGRERWR